MKPIKYVVLMLGCLLLGSVAQGQGSYSYTFTNGFANGGVVPDGNVSGVAVTTNLKVADLVDSVLVHPALSESLADAAE